MIYLWHNTNSGVYEMGNEVELALKQSIYDISIVHEFESDERRFAEKILLNLNRAAGELKSNLAVA